LAIVQIECVFGKDIITQTYRFASAIVQDFAISGFYMQAVIQLEQAVENDCKPNIGLYFERSREVILSFVVSKTMVLFSVLFSARYK
jgi:hypothetical protein